MLERLERLLIMAVPEQSTRHNFSRPLGAARGHTHTLTIKAPPYYIYLITYLQKNDKSI
jgi:hypothetical protein